MRFGHHPPPAGVTDTIRGALDDVSVSGKTCDTYYHLVVGATLLLAHSLSSS